MNDNVADDEKLMCRKMNNRNIIVRDDMRTINFLLLRLKLKPIFIHFDNFFPLKATK